MSTMKVNRLENTSTASGGLDIDTSGNVRVTTLADSSGNNDSTPAEIASGRAKAWVNFNGTGTVAIRASYNVSSITDNGTGDYTINFTNAMSDTNYAVVLTACDEESGGSSSRIIISPRTKATGSQRMSCNGVSSSSRYDCVQANAAIFR